jgi:hypothetical protein
MYLVKNTASLRLTYQIRLLVFRAMEGDEELVIRIPRGCAVSRPLRKLLRQSRGRLRIEAV